MLMNCYSIIAFEFIEQSERFLLEDEKLIEKKICDQKTC